MEQPETEQERSARIISDTLIKIQSSAYGYATAYTAVIIFGGYAGLFTVWSNTKGIIPPRIETLVGLLLGISMFFFVAFEVFKMIMTSKDMLKVRSILAKNYPADELVRKVNDAEKQNNKLVLRVIVPIWICCLVVSLLSGFGAALVLMGTFINSLLS